MTTNSPVGGSSRFPATTFPHIPFTRFGSATWLSRAFSRGARWRSDRASGRPCLKRWAKWRFDRDPRLKGKRTQGNRLLGNPPTTDARQMPHISDGGGRAKNGWRWTGADLTRKDADRFVTGTIDYAADLIRPGGARLQV